jgi:alanine-glyoxylate transaminase/serine-glyoxylate transaminase/serine-pyruvate transaminase
MTFPVSSGGSGAMEAAVANFVLPGSKFGVFAAGYFADRVSCMGQRHGATVVRLEKPWGEVFDAEEAADFLERERPSVVAFVQAETATGAYQFGRAITEAAQRIGAFVIADCVTSLGAMPVEIDAAGIDVAFACSQKALSCPAGLAPMSISPRAWEWLQGRTGKPAAWYLDLRLMAEYFEPPHAYHHTPSPPLYYAMRQSLAMIEEEGLRNRWDRHARAHKRLIAGLEKMGFGLLVKDPRHRIWHVTAAIPPAAVDEAVLRKRLVDDFHVEIGPGLGPLAKSVVRIGTMGPLASDESVDFLLDSIGACI